MKQTESLRDNDSKKFAEYRDTFYSFVYLTGLAARIAVLACKCDVHAPVTGHDFLRKFERCRALLWYLSNFGSGQTGLSGKLEVEADWLYGSFKELQAHAGFTSTSNPE